MANANAILKYEQLEELVTLIYEDIKKKAGLAHTHQATDVIENAAKRFVSDTEKSTWNAKISQSQLDSALNTLASGLTWKGSFPTLEALKALPNPQDGWFGIVTTGENTFYIYESDTKIWQDLGGLMLPGVATTTANGLMTKEMVIKLAGLSNYTLPKATSAVLGGVKSGSIITVDANGILQIDSTKIISAAERGQWNKASTDSALALTKIATTDANLGNAVSRISSVETRTTNLEAKMVYITNADIESLVEASKR
ncbi:hypothetical protein H3N56_03835 [Cetobacterium sp. 2A]|uniref:hypothetical protein n=1 Tax=Cetobacterium sp. 2A TaxID=2754723 RepID=UPI00163D34A8|nr:hypothetical protein [Cetobacterium sp. 2A]MBC2855238.1 hypothetical protein [Cetobacterium sp. 2A]MBC2855286.1 hypothetical protein [Cetobacterium sp. 2A]MBC2855628.1 hypothetical protein [Cetobacterium sp. 2A]